MSDSSATPDASVPEPSVPSSAPSTTSGSAAKSSRRLAVGGLLAAVLVIAYAAGAFDAISWQSVRGQLERLQTAARTDPFTTTLLFALVYSAVTALSLPIASGLGLLAGAMFGRWHGTAVVSVAATIGATLAFLSARYLFADAIRTRFGPRLQAIDRGFERDGAYYLFAMRLAPFIPFFLLNLAAGLTRIRTPVYAAVSWIGMLPGTFLYVQTGSTLSHAETAVELISWETGLVLAALGLVPLVMRFAVRRLFLNHRTA